MLVARIKSIPHNRGGEHGVFELEVVVSRRDMLASGSPYEFTKSEIARHLAGCIRTAKMPLGEGLWEIEFTQEAQRMFNFPAGVTV